MLRFDPGKFQWKWAAGLVLAIAVCVVAAVVVREWRRNANDFRRTQAQGNSNLPPSRLQPLIEHGLLIAGQLVFLNDVKLEAGPAKGVYFVVGAEGTTMLVLAAATSVSAAPHDRVDVNGTVRRLPSEWVMRKQWKLSAMQLKRLQAQKMFVEAASIDAETAD